MRIGIVTQAYFPIHGGVTENAHHTALELEKLGHDVTIITANVNRDDRKFDHRRLRRVGFDVTIPANGAFGNITVGFRLPRELRAIEREKKFDLVQIHSPMDPVLPLVALKVFSAPKVGTFHTYMDSSVGLTLFRRPLQWYFNRLSGRIAVSTAAEKFAKKYFPADYRVIPNGVDIDRFNPAVMPLEKYQDGYTNILFVGRLEPRKGLKFLIQAMPIVLAAIPKARLIVVGGGVLREYYRRFVMDEITDRVIFTGFVPAEDLPRYYRTADLCVSPATQGESFGIVLIEAMSAGKPIVASDIEGYNTVINDGHEGFLVPKEHPLKLAEKIIELIQNKPLRLAMGQRGREKALGYSWPKVTSQIIRYFEEILGQKGKPSRKLASRR